MLQRELVSFSVGTVFFIADFWWEKGEYKLELTSKAGQAEPCSWV